MTDKQHTFQNYKSSMEIWQSVNWATPARQISDQVENTQKHNWANSSVKKLMNAGEHMSAWNTAFGRVHTAPRIKQV